MGAHAGENVRRAIFTKEAICRMTYGVVRNELRFGVRLYRWPGSGRPAISSAERVVQA
jgi:hypothetical protein